MTGHLDAASAELDAATVTDLIGQAHTEVLEEGRRADTKAGHLLSSFGLLAGAVAFVAQLPGLPTAAAITLWLSAAPIAAAFVRLLLAVRPRTAGASYARHAAMTPAAIVREFEHHPSPGEYRALRLRRQSAAAARKYAAIRQAIGLVLLGVAGLPIAGLLNLLCR
uniref:Pycsar system effector family protein n=1 Tax=Amycolatopsis sp. CA-082387 TaxID=3239918 RepID=UPI003F49845D